MGTQRARSHVRTLLNKEEKANLRHLIEHVERETSAEICVMVLKDVVDPRDFAVHYFNHLGIGKKDLDNGLLVLVVLERRHVEIVVGKGLEGVMPRALLEQVINEQMAPHFRDGKFGQGLHHAVEAFGRVLREQAPAVRPDATPGAPGKPGAPRKIPDVVDLDQGGRDV
jgi:uncharacterized protein